MYFYWLYGLHTRSEFQLPELLPDKDNSNLVSDLEIRVGPVAESGIEAGRMVEPACQLSPTEFWFFVPGVARYLVRFGTEIVVDPLPGSDEASIRLYLLGSCLGALMLQRGLLVLHGNAIRVGDACLVCVGDSGAGKSSLAAAFLQRGHQILADDVVPVSATGMAIPGTPRIKLWQQTADWLGISTQGLRRIRPDMDKYDYPVGELFCASPLPIRWIYALTTGEDERVSLQSIQGIERFRVLRDNSYRFHFVEGMGGQARHLQQCAVLSEHVYLDRLVRPASGTTPGDLADCILRDVERLDRGLNQEGP